MTDQSVSNEAVVRVRSGPIVGAVLGRFVGISPVHGQNSPVHVVGAADDDHLELRVSELRPDGGRRLLADGDLPGVGNVFDRVADDVQAGTTPNGETGELILRLNFRA